MVAISEELRCLVCQNESLAGSQADLAKDLRREIREQIAQGRLRDVPPERAIDVVNNLLYGTIFTNYFTGNQKPLEEQARDIVDIVFNGILSDVERERRAAAFATVERSS